MTAETIIAATAASAAIIASVLGGVKKLLAPHLKEAVRTTIGEVVGPKLEEMPLLTSAVDRLTDAIHRQTEDTEKLAVSMEGLGVKVDHLAIDVVRLSGRTEALEKMHDEASHARKSARRGKTG